MNKEIIKQGIAEAEKEAQQEQINKVKKIVQAILEKIESKRKIEDAAREERKLLEKDLDDLKAGRLDQIEERQAKDPKAREISVILVKKIEKEYVPYYPWKSPWFVEMKNDWSYIPSISNPGIDIFNMSSVTTFNQLDNLILTAFGTDFQNFTKGSYNIHDKIINL